MKVFGKTLFGGGTTQKAAADVPAKQEDGSYFYPMGAGASFGKGGELSDHQRLYYYLQIPELNTVINLRARASANMKAILVDKNTEDELKRYPNDPFYSQLKDGNYFQSQWELLSQTNIFRDVFGNEFIYPSVPYGMTSPSGIFSLPSQDVEIDVVGDRLKPFFLYNEIPESVNYKYKGAQLQEVDLDKNYLVHLNDNNIRTGTDADFLKGASRIDPLVMPLANIEAAYEARNVIIVNRGAIGILSNASKDGIGGVAPLDVKEKEKLQQEFRKYGLTKSQWQVIITNLSLSWQQMAIDVDKLKLFEETREDTLKICDQYGTPFELLSAYKNTTFDNKREAQRQWYRDTIIPEQALRFAAISKKWLKNKNYRIVPKFDHLPIFEEERKDKARGLLLTVNALSKALEDGAITIEQYTKELKNYGI